MTGKLAIAGLIGLGCVAAAAGGGYMALRSNAADVQAMSAAAVPDPSTPQAASLPAAPETPAPSEPVTAAAAPASAATETASRSETLVRAPRVAPRQTPAAEARSTATANASTPSPSPTPVAPVPVSEPTQTSAAATAPAPAQAAPQTPAAAPAPKYDEVSVPADSVLGLRIDSTVSTETARVEDRVNARIARDVLVDGRVAIPTGARLEGTVTTVERGGKFKDRPRIGVTFTSLIFADGTRTTIQTEEIFRNGESPSGQANAKVGGSAVVGAILGAMIGGKKGALLGGTAGAAGGAAAVASGERPEAVMVSGTQLTVRLGAPITVLIEREHD